MSEYLPQIVQQTFNGLSLGAIYALIAIGYTMVYGIIGMINFAHGEIYMIGAYVGLVTLTALGTQGSVPLPLAIGLMLAIAMIVTALYGYSVERIAYRPVRGGPRLVALISAIGMSIFLQNWVALGQGSRDMAVPSLISGGIDIPFGNFDVTFSWSRILIIVVTVVLMVGLSLYIRHSRMGRASRACSQDMQMARLLGIDTNRVISFTFVLGAVLAAVGGVLIAITIGKLNPFIGFIAGIKAFTAAVLGGRRRCRKDWQRPRCRLTRCPDRLLETPRPRPTRPHPARHRCRRRLPRQIYANRPTKRRHTNQNRPRHTRATLGQPRQTTRRRRQTNIQRLENMGMGNYARTAPRRRNRQRSRPPNPHRTRRRHRPPNRCTPAPRSTCLRTPMDSYPQQQSHPTRIMGTLPQPPLFTRSQL